MESETLSKASAVTRPRLYGIVHTYIQKQLPRDIHPAFKALRDREEAATALPQIGSIEQATSSLPVEREQTSRIDVVGENKDDVDDDLPLYAASQGECPLVVDSIKRRVV